MGMKVSKHAVKNPIKRTAINARFLQNSGDKSKIRFTKYLSYSGDAAVEPRYSGGTFCQIPIKYRYNVLLQGRILDLGLCRRPEVTNDAQ